MVIGGKWWRCDDGSVRPVVPVRVLAADGPFLPELFLVDTGADRTVFSADLLARLRTDVVSPGAGIALQGVGGKSAHVLVSTVVEFTRDDGGTATVRGEYAAFTDRAATDLSILGRYVLDLFDVLISKRREEVLLITANHKYRVEPT